MSFQEQMNRIQAELEWYLRTPSASRAGCVVADFGATSVEAAQELAYWWRGHPGIEVEIREQRPPTPQQLEQAAAHFGWTPERILSLRVPDLHPWSVQVTGPSCQAPGFRVKDWVDLLRATPQDPRWEYTGGAVEDLSARGEPSL
jgi:hypothetical protein